MAVIGGAESDTGINVAGDGTTDLWKPVIDELQALGETVSQEDMSWIYIFITGFVGGLLALFTPCVWPIIPMIFSVLLKRCKDKKNPRCLDIRCVYCSDKCWFRAGGDRDIWRQCFELIVDECCF